MDPTYLLNNLDPTNQFAMGGLNTAFVSNLTWEGKPFPKTLFIDIVTEKTKMLIEHLKHLHLGLSLPANINENVATIRLYDNYAINSLLLHATISNLWDIEGERHYKGFCASINMTYTNIICTQFVSFIGINTYW